MNAFLLLNSSRKVVKTEMGVDVQKIDFADIVKYAETFPDDVDDKRNFILSIQAIDEEFLKHGIRQSKTTG